MSVIILPDNRCFEDHELPQYCGVILITYSDEEFNRLPTDYINKAVSKYVI